MSPFWSVVTVVLIVALAVSLWWLLTFGDDYSTANRKALDAANRRSGRMQRRWPR